MCIYIYIFSLSLSQHAYYIVIMIGCCLLLRPLLRTVCSETAASARWSRYLAEQHKISSCYIYTEGGVIMKSVSFRSNSTIKDHDAPEWAFICQWRRYLALNVFSRRTAGQHSQRSRHRSMLDLRSDCGKCSNVALTEMQATQESLQPIAQNLFWSVMCAIFSFDHMAAFRRWIFARRVNPFQS